jgi:uncharacterized protein YjiS (DUF1127 family)
MAYVNTTRVAAERPLIGFAGWIAGLKAAYARRSLYLRTLNELRALTDRELTDLGLSRVGIEDVAREAAYGAK